MGVCNPIKRLDGNLIGDFLDILLFESAGYRYEDIIEDETIIRKSEKIRKVCRFDFSAVYRRSNVIIEENENYTFYIKGSPEHIYPLLEKESVPSDYWNALHTEINTGSRIIACGMKYLNQNVDSDTIERSEMKHNIKFLGFIIMESMIRKETLSVINLLKDAEFALSVCTGDHLIIAVEAAKPCVVINQGSNVYICEMANNNVVVFSHSDNKQESIYIEIYVNGILVSYALGMYSKRL
eukprot:GHVP01001081.1.p1 GENE.GHVP01001081.1~~GHVP01001081.1.p1  ORF type:complete len:239 (-),score=25.48 GHVP01001081.1:3363-4079(-)